MSPEEKAFLYRHEPVVVRFFNGLRQKGIIPKITAYDCTGFHGTSKENAAGIQKNGLKPTLLSTHEDAILGEGGYLWDDIEDYAKRGGAKAAKDWALKRRKFHSSGLVVARLSFKRLFDLMENQNLDFFIKVHKWLDSHAEYWPHRMNGATMLADWQTVKFIILACPRLADLDIDGVRWDGIRVLPHEHFGHMALCVKDASCIKSLEVAR